MTFRRGKDVCYASRATGLGLVCLLHHIDVRLHVEEPRISPVQVGFGVYYLPWKKEMAAICNILKRFDVF
ncbi:hypothetical protein ADL26_14545 [Thermoactinomyces vulgaris]|jgi:hypothetical protein|nr:hypothetical protein ADL26_14545 [Thermoactinomyces vulgaris]